MATILPSGEEMKVTPDEILRYLNPDGLRQMMRQERLRWLLKTNRDTDYYDNTRLFKYAGEVHNEGMYSRMEIHTYPDNGAYPGFAGVHIDSGLYGLLHNYDKWSMTLSDESRSKVVNRTMIGATAKIPNLIGIGVDDEGYMSDHTENRTAGIVFDPYDGRSYVLSNDEQSYINNDEREHPLPGRTLARIVDIPTRITQLTNDLGFISDKYYNHTDNNFTHSNRFIVDNIDDRTFVYPSISKNKDGVYVANKRTNLNGTTTYHPGVFVSLEELQSVDLIHQIAPMRSNSESADGRRPYNYYRMDGVWGNDPKTSTSQNPANMEQAVPDVQPVGHGISGKMYQWRYNRVDSYWYSKDITITVVNGGEGYKIGDELSYTFGDDSLRYIVDQVGVHGEIQDGKYIVSDGAYFTDDPGTNGRGVTFTSVNGVGYNATLAINTIPTMETYATQIKNNLYAYVNMNNPQISDNDESWSDIHAPNDQNGNIAIRSTDTIAYTGINSGRGGYEASPYSDKSTLYEHGGNVTAGDNIHLFRYVINTTNPTYVIVDGVIVYTGEWVDQGPCGINDPADIKALYLTNPDTNNFNNYYKFMLDMLFDTMDRCPDSIISNNDNAVSGALVHIDQIDPASDRRFTQRRIDNITGEIIEKDITDRVLYINASTGMLFIYNKGFKNDPTFAYGTRSPGWMPIAGATTR